ncbi:hypothetical protein REPUB_Repub05bG0174700 [Reevesia pubescens]
MVLPVQLLNNFEEKARRWRHSFTKKKKYRLDLDFEDEDPEYFGSPMNESEVAPEGYKENARQYPRAIPVISEKHVLASCVKPVSEQGKKEPTFAETNAKKPEPANATGTDATQKITSKIQGLFVIAPTGSETEKHATQETAKHALKTDIPLSLRKNKWDKGVSVKDALRAAAL